MYSNASRSRIEATLKHTGYKGYFEDRILSGTDENMIEKPDPRMLKELQNRMDLEPENCIVVDSSTYGLDAARSAGCFCVMISHLFSSPKRDISGLEYVGNAIDLRDWFRTLFERNKKIGNGVDLDGVAYDRWLRYVLTGERRQ